MLTMIKPSDLIPPHAPTNHHHPLAASSRRRSKNRQTRKAQFVRSNRDARGAGHHHRTTMKRGRKPMKAPPHISIYHTKQLGKFGPSIRLNLDAVSDLLGRVVPTFDSLTAADKLELQFRFDVYRLHGHHSFDEIDNLPRSSAVTIARSTAYSPPLCTPATV